MSTGTGTAPFGVSLVAGGAAGTCVDVVLFPLDTIKTRLQSAQGFAKAGGCRGIFNGLSSAVIGSAPAAALFFCTYEMSKQILSTSFGDKMAPANHMVAASFGEMAGCLVRVPTEQVKQRMQSDSSLTAKRTIRNISNEYGKYGLWRGYGSLLLREIPFSIIQFPLYEYLKHVKYSRTGRLEPYESALCGTLAGATAAGLTTPLDVVKTRIMIAKDGKGGEYNGVRNTFQRIASEEGWPALFKGFVPRVTWIGLGGYIFFGVIEEVKKQLMTV